MSRPIKKTADTFFTTIFYHFEKPFNDKRKLLRSNEFAPNNFLRVILTRILSRFIIIYRLE